MGLFDSLTGGDSGPEDDGPDAYRVVRKTDKGGWKPVEEFDRMDEPIDKGTFEYNAAPLQPGEYRLFAIEGNLQRQPPEGQGWVLQIEGEQRDDEQDDQIRKLERKIDRMASSETQQEPQDPQELVEKQKASLQLAALQSEDFLRKYGDEIVLGMFDAGPGGNDDGSAIGFEDWQENPVGSTLYETLNMVREDPQQVEALGQAIGRGVGTFVGSAADGMADTDGSLADVRKAAQDGETGDTSDAEEEPDPTGGRDLDAGPSTLSDLDSGDGGADTDELADSLADARTQLRTAGPGTQDRPESGRDSADTQSAGTDTTDTAATDDTDDSAATQTPDAAIDDNDPMTATPTPNTDSGSDSGGDDTADEIAGAL